MSFFSRATPAPTPKTSNTWLASLLLAVFLVMMIVAQLFTFEKFPDLLADSWLPGGDAWMPIYAGVIVALEVLALPFLLSMKLSKAMRAMSMVFGWLVVLAWLVISVGSVVDGHIAESGLLGATAPLPTGWWSVSFCAGLAVLAIWAAWGMWPLKNRRK